MEAACVIQEVLKSWRDKLLLRSKSNWWHHRLETVKQSMFGIFCKNKICVQQGSATYCTHAKLGMPSNF